MTAPIVPGPRLTEKILHGSLPRELFQQAEADLAASHVVERVIYRNGALQARWSTDSDADLTFMLQSPDEVLAECTCQTFQSGTECRHIPALALAWARGPKTFGYADRDYTASDFYDEHVAVDEAGDLDDERDSEVAASDQPEEAGTVQGGLFAPPESRLAPTLKLAPPDLTEDFSKALEGIPVADLREIARNCGIALSGSRRDDIVLTLATALGRPEAVAAAVAKLSTAARSVLALLPFAARAGRLDLQNLQKLASALTPSPWPGLSQGLKDLEAAGLLQRRTVGTYSWPAGLLGYAGIEPNLARPPADGARLRVVKSGPLRFADLAARLLFVLRARPWAARPPPAPGPAALAQLLGGWGYVPAEVGAFTRPGASRHALYSATLTVPPAQPILTDEALGELARQLEADPAELDFALRLLSAMQLIGRNPDDRVVMKEDTFLQFVSQHPVQSVLPFYQAWLSLGHWIELDYALSRVAGLRLRRDLNLTYGLPASHLAQAMLSARAGLQHYLDRTPAGVWIDVAAFVTQAHALNMFGALWRLPQGVQLEINGRALLPQPLTTDWANTYGNWVEAALTGPLFWQGAVDLGYDDDRLAAFRLTELGGFLTHKTPAFTAPELAAAGTRGLVFEVDGTLRLQLAAAEAQLLSLLATLGDLRAAPGGGLICTPTASGALRVFESGWTAEKIIGALEQAAGQPVPAALARQWRGWWGRLGELQVYPGLALLELGDDFAFDELMANTSLARYLLFRFGPRLAALRQDDAPALIAELVAKGYTPKVLPASAPQLAGQP